jgi:uncharacterized membrane protein/ketosteroid isomerase-like protein
MSDLIIPNWHPLMVHFTVALLTISAVFFVLSKLMSDKAETFELVAKWTLWVGAGITALTILAGIGAYNSVDHDDVAHKVMKVHRLYAFVTGGAILLFAIWTFRAKSVSMAMIAGSLVVAGMVGATGYLGAELVYRHGLGVMRLPDTSGAGHEHAPGQGHGDAAPKAGGHEHAEGKGHGDAMPAKEEEGHEHAEGKGHGDAMPAKEEEGHEHAEGKGHGDAMPAKEEEGHEHAEGKGHGDAMPAKKEGHGHEGGGHDEAPTPAVDQGAISDALHAALKTGDEAAVSMLLADDVLIMEGAHAQSSKAQYMSGHMKSDMKVVPFVTVEIVSREVGQDGDVAWITTHSNRSGSYKGKSLDSTSREFLLMKRFGDDWKITLIQWSQK